MPEPQTPRTLVVVRHAKTEKHAATDAGRPLTERGLHSARDLATWLGTELANATAADTAVSTPYLDSVLYLLGISRDEVDSAQA